MEEKLINSYANYFKHLKRAYNKELGKAPHKPILLLSVIELIQNGQITSNRIFITPELLLTFKKNWSRLVETRHISNFSLPFFHLRSEPFWYLVTKIGSELEITNSKSIKSFNSLNNSIAFAEIDKELFNLLLNEVYSSFFIELILNEYFKNSRLNYYTSRDNETEIKIENQILNEPKEAYQNHIIELRKTLNENELEEELFVRGGLFKKTIPKIYNYSCCISGMKIESSKNVQMIDACHIVPFSISNDDTIPNGISLSPNLHRAFDRGLITINKDYIVRLSPTIQENYSVFSLSQFEGKQINLPNKTSWYPSPESLKWHNKEVYLI